MESRPVGGSHNLQRKATSKLSTLCVQLLDLQIVSSSLILFFVVLVTLFCFVYFEILQFIPSGGLVLSISSVRSLSHLASHSFAPTHRIIDDALQPLRSPFFDQETSEDAAQNTSPLSHPPSSSFDNDKDPFILPNIQHPSVNSSPLTIPVVEISPPSSPIVNNLPQSSPFSDSVSEISPSFNPILDSSTHTDAIKHKSSSLAPKEPSKSSNWSSGSVPRMEASNREDRWATVSGHPSKKRKQAQCNLFEGKWIKDESYPLYKSQSCPFMDGGFRCQENGRTDDDYLKWRWQPSGCNLPRFNGEDMLKRLRGGRLVFVGDSIGRNQWESLLCMLATDVYNKTRIYEVNGEPITKHKGFLIFRFEAYDCTIEYYRSPFLVPQGRPPPNRPQGVKTTLRVDTMDWTSKRWLGARVIVFNDGHWWSYEKTIRGGCYFEVAGKVNKSMSVRDGFERAMQTWRRWVASNIDPRRTRVFFRTYAPVHFSGGTWQTGGGCDQEREPYAEAQWSGEPWTNGVVIAQTEQLRHATLLNITYLSHFRKDAHSSIYNVGPSQPRAYNRQDCSHWCLPGLPDTWNELLYASLLQSGQRPWQQP